MVAAALALCALGSVPGRAQVKEGFQAQEIAKLQDHLLTHVGDYVASAKRAVVNPETRGESRAYTLADPVAYGQIVPHLITASFAGPVEFLVTVLSICQGSEYGAYCRERIVTKRVGGAAEAPIRDVSVMTGEDADAYSSADGSVRLRIASSGIVDLRVNGERKVLNGNQLISLLSDAAKAGEMRRQIKAAKEDSDGRLQALEDRLEALRLGGRNWEER